MKQKYTLMIGDLQLNVVADANREEVEKLAGILDRKMREIYLHSRGCSKNEAALLCALEFCSERMELQTRAADMETRNQKYAVVLENFKKQTEEQNAEIERLQAENAVLRSLITGKGGTIPEPAVPVPPSQFLEEVAEAQYGETAPAEAPVPKAKRSRVGSMFDQLSFEEV